MSDTPYEDIPTGGGEHRGSEHRGGTTEYEQSSNVRAQDPPPLPDESEEDHTFQIMESDTMGTYRVRRWKPGQEVGSAAQDYEEKDRTAANDALDASIREHTTERRYAVLENTETGEVFMDQQENISDNWFGGEGDEFDQITFFADESEATAYADEQRGKAE